jgi:hypothetical protein
MRYFIALGCMIGFVAMCVLALIHVFYEMWRDRPYAASDSSAGSARSRSRNGFSLRFPMGR